MITAYKVFTHDLRSPIQGGDPVWVGRLPYQLPGVEVDSGPRECAAGWNACRDPETAIKIAGLWPNGRPSRIFELQSSGPVVERGQKMRAESWLILRELEMAPVIRRLSKAFGDLADEMAAEQVAWHTALGRPRHNKRAVTDGLQLALGRRGLDWQIRQYDSARDAWDAWDARDARAARAAAWDARAAWAAWAARAARAARDARDALAAWAARAAWDARDAWDAWAAWAALVMHYAARRGWINHDPRLLSAGLRWAYRNGLGIALPTDSRELGWAMAD
jgi:hypothetical protein